MRRHAALLLAIAGSAVAVLAVGVALVLVRAVGGTPAGYVVAQPTEIRGLALPHSLPAGTPLTIAAADLPAGAAAVLAHGSAGTWTTTVTVTDGAVHAEIPPHLTGRSGLLRIEVRVADTAVRGVTQVLAGPTVAPLQLVVGARSITADGDAWAMGIALPEDALGNPAAEGTPGVLTVEHPDGVREVLATEVQGLLVRERIHSRTLAGRARLALDVDGVAAPEAELEEVPGPPTAVTLGADPVILVADGRDLIGVRTGTLVDEHGNVVADGTEVTFTVTTPGGELRLASAPTVNGVAEVPVQAPGRAGVVIVRADVLGVRSPVLELAFAPDLAQDHPVLLDGDIVRVGPVRSRLGQLAPDGTPVTVRWTRPDGAGEERTAQLVDGRADVAVGAHATSSLVVSVGEGGPWRDVGP